MNEKETEKVWESARYLPIRQRMENSDLVKSLARKFADTYGLHMETVEKETGIVFRICARDMLYTRMMKKELVGLLNLCDEFSITARGQKEWDYVLELVYYTHDVCVNGKRICLADEAVSAADPRNGQD